jgi:hypothetical protein
MHDTYILYDEYGEEYFVCDTITEARKIAKRLISTDGEDRDSSFEVGVYKHIGNMRGLVEVKVEEKWNEDVTFEEAEETTTMVEAKPYLPLAVRTV